MPSVLPARRPSAPPWTTSRPSNQTPPTRPKCGPTSSGASTRPGPTGPCSGGEAEMSRIVVLDAGPLGLASQPRGLPRADDCRDWIRDLDAAGVRVVAPEVADYEVRRELLRVGAT